MSEDEYYGKGWMTYLCPDCGLPFMCDPRDHQSKSDEHKAFFCQAQYPPPPKTEN